MNRAWPRTVAACFFCVARAMLAVRPRPAISVIVPLHTCEVAHATCTPAVSPVTGATVGTVVAQVVNEP